MPFRPALWNDLFNVALVGLAILSALSVSHAALVNVTVDDSALENGVSRILYEPAGGWLDGSNCTTCLARPPTNQAWDGSWHDSTFFEGEGEENLRTATLVFNGSAIYVYCILSHSLNNPVSTSDMVFFIDGESVGQFSLQPDGRSSYDFNVLVYHNLSLPSGTHLFTLQNGRVGGYTSLALLDYIVYSQDDGSVPGHDSSTPMTLPPALPPPLSPVSDTTTFGLSLPPTSFPISISTPAITLPFSSTTTVISQSSDANIPPPMNAQTSSIPSALPNSGTTQSESQKESSPSHARTIIVAVTIPSAVALITLVVAAIVFYRRKHSKHPYQHEPPSEPNITEDPLSSGWVEDAFGRREGSGVYDHPSLIAGQSVPRPLRGDFAARDTVKARRERDLAKNSSTRSVDTNNSAAQQAPPVPTIDAGNGSSDSVVAVQMAKLNRHPYAARTPEPDMDVPMTGAPEQESVLLAGTSTSPTYPPTHYSVPRNVSISPPASARSPSTADTTASPMPQRPAAARQRSGSRPLPMRPVLESQAHAARVRRQNSATRSQALSSHLSDEDLPPSYEASRAPHVRR